MSIEGSSHPRTKASSASSFDPKNDLVEDRAIEDSKLDRFGHADFATQAALTIKALRTPANIAIYAPWGSGKSSLANFLKTELQNGTSGFVYFDAFKYAEAPLRREFIRRVAKDLEIKHDKFDRGLYVEENWSRFNLKKESVNSLFLVGAVAVAAAVFIGLLSLLLAWSSGKGVWSEWTTYFEHLAPAIFAPALIISPLIALIGGQLSIGNKRYAPQSDEEFERLFRDIVKRALDSHKEWNRLVVFIDELDRCAADEVASTLETLRTFLEVEGCVFVVAADRSVLESAVAKRSRQETPYNAQNPYYSTGSSYLDKIFQYQWQLPPIKASSLTRFAVSLVKDRASGVWHDVDVGTVASVLVPLHVQSPRRVKELLNAYAMSYRLAQRRIADGRLDTDLQLRAAELAKLVCLQLEFPVFANDLPNEPRMPQLILELVSGTSHRPEDVSDDIWERIEAYARSNVALDVVIADTPDAVSVDDESTPDAPTESLTHIQGNLLIRYLQKTQRIPGPGADLIFMEGTGFAFGLPTALAERLKAAATEGRIEDVNTAVAPLSESQQVAALQLLAGHVHEALFGVEGRNALSTLLGVIGALPQLDLSQVVDELADAVNVGINDDGLPAGDIAGAICLGLKTTRSVGSELLARALSDDEILTDPDTAALIAERANEFSKDHVERLGQVVAALLVDLEWNEVPQTLNQWSDVRAIDLLTATRKPLLARLAAASERAKEAQATAATAAAAVPPAVAEVPVEAATEEASKSGSDVALSRLNEMIDAARTSERFKVLEAIVELVLALNTTDARHLAVSALPSDRSVESATLTDALLVACLRREITDMPRWLDIIAPGVFSQLSKAKVKLEDIVLKVWPSDSVDEAGIQAFRVFSTSAGRLAKSIEWLPAERLVEAVRSTASISGFDSASLEKWASILGVVREFEAASLLQAEDWRASYLEAAIQIASNVPPDEATRAVAFDLLIRNVLQVVRGQSGDVVDRLFEALRVSPWLNPAERTLARTTLVKTEGPGTADGSHTIEIEEISGAFEHIAVEPQFEDVANEAAGVWLSGSSPTIDEVWKIVARFAASTLPGQVEEGLRTFTLQLSSVQRTELASHALAVTPETTLSDSFLDAIQFHDSDLAKTTDLVIEAFGRATNDEQRRSVVRLWGDLKLTDHRLIRLMVQGIMNPLIEHGKSARELALQNLNLVQALPKQDKRKIAELFEVNSQSDEWADIRRKLQKAGLMVERGSFLNRRIEHL